MNRPRWLQPGRTRQHAGHDHGLPASLLAMVIVCVLGLAAGILLSYARTQSVENRLAVVQEYLEGRGEFRDAEADRLEDRIDQVVCDILGEFPTGDERADRLRVRYGCLIPEATEPP